MARAALARAVRDATPDGLGEAWRAAEEEAAGEGAAGRPDAGLALELLGLAASARGVAAGRGEARRAAVGFVRLAAVPLLRGPDATLREAASRAVLAALARAGAGVFCERRGAVRAAAVAVAAAALEATEADADADDVRTVRERSIVALARCVTDVASSVRADAADALRPRLGDAAATVRSAALRGLRAAAEDGVALEEVDGAVDSLEAVNGLAELRAPVPDTAARELLAATFGAVLFAQQPYMPRSAETSWASLRLVARLAPPDVSMHALADLCQAEGEREEERATALELINKVLDEVVEGSKAPDAQAATPERFQEASARLLDALSSPIALSAEVHGPLVHAWEERADGKRAGPVEAAGGLPAEALARLARRCFACGMVARLSIQTQAALRGEDVRRTANRMVPYVVEVYRGLPPWSSVDVRTNATATLTLLEQAVAKRTAERGEKQSAEPKAELWAPATAKEAHHIIRPQQSAGTGADGGSRAVAPALGQVVDAIAAAQRLMWLACNIESSSLPSSIPLLLPPTLAAIDHWCVSVKTCGLNALCMLAEKDERAAVELRAHSALLRDAVTHALCGCREAAWPAATMAAMSLSLVLGEDDRAWYMAILEAYVADAEMHPHNVERNLTWLKTAPYILEACGLPLVKLLGRIVPLLTGFLRQCAASGRDNAGARNGVDATTYAMVSNVSQCVEAMCKSAWPRMHAHARALDEELHDCQRLFLEREDAPTLRQDMATARAIGGARQALSAVMESAAQAEANVAAMGRSTLDDARARERV